MAERSARAPLQAMGSCVVLLLAACAAPAGDFGRADTDTAVMRMGPHPYGGPALTTKVRFALSHDEIDMRSLTWRYFAFADGSPAVVNVPGKAPDLYYRWIKGQPYAAAEARFARLDADIKADLAGVPDTFAAICAVQTVDRQRGVAAKGTPNLDARFLRGAAARVTENRALIARFTDALAARTYAYDFALDHLLIETPDPAAARVGSSLDALEDVAKQAAAGQFCGGKAPVVREHQARSVPSRYGAG